MKPRTSANRELIIFFASLMMSFVASLYPSSSWGLISAPELLEKGIKQVNNSTATGEYFSVGANADNGQFRSIIKLPNSMQWNLVSANDKQEREFKWSQEKGIEFSDDPQKANSDIFTKFALTPIGKITISTFISQFLNLTDSNSLVALTTPMKIEESEKFLALNMRSAIPGLNDFEALWKFEPKTFKLLSWNISSQHENHLMVFKEFNPSK